LARHVHGEPLDPRQAAPDRAIPDMVASLCMRLLAKQPEARPSAEALADTLRAMLVNDRTTLAAVRVGPRELAAGPEQDTQVLGGAVVEAGISIADRPTLPPMDAFASSTSSATAQLSSSSTTAAIETSTLVPVEPAHRVMRRVGWIVGAAVGAAVVLVGALSLAYAMMHAPPDAATPHEQTVAAPTADLGETPP